MSKLQTLIELAVREWFPGETIHINDHPEWLYGMEIDIYLPRIGIAIEVQGRQHHLFCPELHKTLQEHQMQRWRDTRKRQIMSRRFITLFVVKEGDRHVMGGLQTKLSNFLRVRLKTPHWLHNAWRNHQRSLAKKQQTNLCFKVRKGNKLVPVNATSSLWLQSQVKSPNSSKLSEAGNARLSAKPLTPGSSQSPGVVPIRDCTHPGGAVIGN